MTKQLEEAIQVQDSIEVRRPRGRPRKQPRGNKDFTPKRPRGRPRKKAGGCELASLYRDQQEQLVVHEADWGSSTGITTRAKRALLRSQEAGLILECSEEVAIEGLVREISISCRRNLKK